MKSKREKQEKAKLEIADFLKKRQVEVEELRAQNQALNVVVKSADPAKDTVR